MPEGHGITRDQSSKWQQLAEVPEHEFEAALHQPGIKPTTNRVLNPAQGSPVRPQMDLQTVASRCGAGPVHPGSIALPPASCAARTKMAAQRNSSACGRVPLGTPAKSTTRTVIARLNYTLERRREIERRGLALHNRRNHAGRACTLKGPLPCEHLI